MAQAVDVAAGGRPVITGRLAARSAGAPFFDAVIAGGRLAFFAGQGPILNGTPVGGPIAGQTRVTLQNLAGILQQLGADASAVVHCTCHLAGLGDVARTAAAAPRPVRAEGLLSWR